MDFVEKERGSGCWVNQSMIDRRMEQRPITIGEVGLWIRNSVCNHRHEQSLRRMSKRVRCRMSLQNLSSSVDHQFRGRRESQMLMQRLNVSRLRIHLESHRKVDCHKRDVPAHLLCMNSFRYGRRQCQGMIAYCSDRRVRSSMRSDANESSEMILSFKNEDPAHPQTWRGILS